MAETETAEARRARIVKNPKAYPRAYAQIAANWVRACARKASRVARETVAKALAKEKADYAVTYWRNAYSEAAAGPAGTATWSWGVVGLFVDSFGLRVASTMLGVPRPALRCVVQQKRDVVSASHIMRRLALLREATLVREWRSLVSPRARYREDGTEIVLPPLATYLGIARKYLRHTTERVWGMVKRSVRAVRDVLASFTWQGGRERSECFASYTYLQQVHEVPRKPGSFASRALYNNKSAECMHHESRAECKRHSCDGRGTGSIYW